MILVKAAPLSLGTLRPTSGAVLGMCGHYKHSVSHLFPRRLDFLNIAFQHVKLLSLVHVIMALLLEREGWADSTISPGWSSGAVARDWGEPPGDGGLPAAVPSGCLHPPADQL